MLFRSKNVQVTYPGQQMLRASDGKWQQDVSIFVDILIGTPDIIDGKLVDVVKPNRTFKILIDRRQYVEVEIERVVQLSNTTFEFFGCKATSEILPLISAGPMCLAFKSPK